MGCLPLPLLFLLGAGIGYMIARQDGALWGAGIGLLLGLAATLAALRALRGKR
ncbi:MAG: hypothetical protein ABW154_09220 [Dyella sp.]